MEGYSTTLFIKWMTIVGGLSLALFVTLFIFKTLQNGWGSKRILMQNGAQAKARIIQYRRISLTQVRATMLLDVDGGKVAKETIVAGKSDDWFALHLANEQAISIRFLEDREEIMVV